MARNWHHYHQMQGLNCQNYKEVVFSVSSLPDAYKYEKVDPDNDITYITYGKFPDRNMRALNRFRKNPKKFLCINDVMDHSDQSGGRWSF